jgi:hypothetical protein
MAMTIKEKLGSMIPALRKERADLVKESGEVKISDVTISQAIGGMRGVKAWCATPQWWSRIRALSSVNRRS